MIFLRMLMIYDLSHIHNSNDELGFAIRPKAK